jgi:hypothetical protein
MLSGGERCSLPSRRRRSLQLVDDKSQMPAQMPAQIPAQMPTQKPEQKPAPVLTR